MTVRLEEMNHAPAEAIKNLKNVAVEKCEFNLYNTQITFSLNQKLGK